jgi:transcriptional regulator of stress and heat shock response
MRISTSIENFIKDLISQTGGTVEIRRNELAVKFACVPSQINYVISTRFTVEQGYIVESRRGSGGSIKIKKIDINNDNYLMHIVNSIGNSISMSTAEAYLRNLIDYNVIDAKDARLILAAVSDKSILASPPLRDVIRAAIFKNIIIHLV